MVAKTLPGLEGVLAEELVKLGAKDVRPLRLAAAFSGNAELLYSCNHNLRTALRVLVPLSEFDADNPDGLYRQARTLSWDRYFGPDDTFAVDASISSGRFPNSNFAALKVKDAVADHFMDKKGRRPSVDTDAPGVPINLHIDGTRCTLSLDSSGASLHRRGYRLEKTEAPLSEVLAAGLLLLSGWKPEAPLFDPLCGSGTFLAEGGLMAVGTPPGALRKSYGFMRWKNYDPSLWEKIVQRSGENRRTPPAAIWGSDRDPKAVEIARNNLRRAGLGDVVTLKTASFEETVSPLPEGVPGHIIMNPPYGKRLDDPGIFTLYRTLGDTLKRRYSGYTAWIFSSNLDAVKHIGLRPFRRIPLKNGPLECRFVGYNLFSGSKE
jgi:putative N6-adenine-specific DNA methylase